LHKALLEDSRVSYEKIYNRPSLGGPQLLQLLIHDPWFAWLRPLSALIAQIDFEQEDKKNPMTEESAQALLQQVRSLLTPGDSEEPFARRYRSALQDGPDIVILHAEALGR
jgi:hypothetical protein